MKKIIIAALSLLTFSHAQDAKPNAVQIIQTARMATALQQAELQGTLTNDQTKVPVALFLKGRDIQFQYFDSKNWVPFHLRLNDDSYDLFEIVGDKTIPFSEKKIATPIMNTDLTYEDLAMRFFYWKNPILEGEERVSSHNCYKIRLNNPGKSGAYSVIYVWVHTKFGAFMKIEGFDKQGKPLKRFVVDSVQNIGGDVYTLEQMSVSTLNPNNGRELSRTKVVFEKPKVQKLKGPR